MQENWKPVIGYEKHYEVSDLGNIRTIARVVKRVCETHTNTQNVVSRLRKLQVCESGYVRVSLCKNGKVKFFYVHTLVLGSFVGPKPDGYDCDHKDKDRSNNNLSNLRYLIIKKNRGIKGNKHALKNK